MNNCIFTTHATLTKAHAEHSLRSLFEKQTNHDVIWENFIVYNTHANEIPNAWLTKLIKTMAGDFGQIANLFVFPYEDGLYPKTLTQDTMNHLQLLSENEMNAPGKTLLLKSEYCVSNNFNEVFQQQSNINMIWSLPIHNAKEKVTIDEIYAKLGDPIFIPIDEVTYYRGGTNAPFTPGTMDDPYDERSLYEPDIDETDPRFKFVSHNIQNDYNLHVFSNDILSTCLRICRRVYDPRSTWGGAHDLFNGAFKLGHVRRCTETRAYGVHMYHGIISDNRSEDRTDPRKIITGERY